MSVRAAQVLYGELEALARGKRHEGVEIAIIGDGVRPVLVDAQPVQEL